jgi:hypothetical protein
MTEPLPPPDANDAIPRRTTPTWEMELLLSGATVFALFQAAQAIHGANVYLLTRLAGDWQMLIPLLITYAHGAVMVLGLAFALHLGMRAYWVALVGMNSVFPGGLDVRRMRAGPLTRDLLQRRWVDMDTVIERADNRATVVFALGISIAIVLLPLSAVVAALFGVSALIAAALGRPGDTMTAYMVVGGVLLLPYLLATALDRWRGERLVPGSWLQRTCAATLAGYARIGMSRDYSPLVTLFQTNIGERRGTAVVISVMLLALFGSVAAMKFAGNDLGFGNFGAFPSPRRGMDASTDGRHYASNHEIDRSPWQPFVPDRVSRGAYLPLVVPYVPETQGHLLRDCAVGTQELDDTADERQRRAALLRCVAAGIAVTLDGEPLPLLPDWYSQPDRDIRGLLYMIDVRDLANGRHELTVLATPDPEAAKNDDEARAERERQPYRIPFWR